MKLIIIDGIIGEGKSTLIEKIIQSRPNFKRITEIAEDSEINLIELFKGSNPEMRENLIMTKIALDYFKIISKASKNDVIIADRIFSASKYWTKFHGCEPSSYLLWLIEEVQKVLKVNDVKILYIYLSNEDKNILLSNIKKRGREYEQSMTKEDLIRLESIYKNAFHDLEDLHSIAQRIELSNEFYQNEERILLSLIEAFDA